MTFPPLKSPLKFYAVVPTADWVERMVKAGTDTVQLRCKILHGDELKREIERCVVACAIEAAGLRLGLSTHSVAELDRALSVQPSYVASGAIFPTTTKQMPTAPQGLEKLREYVKQARGIPVVAIGGIDLNNAEDVLATGVSSLAVVRAVTEAENPEAVVKAFQALWDE